MLAVILALAVLAPSGPPSRAQATAAVQPVDPTTTAVEDIVVNGRPLSEATSDFVERIAAPASDRGAATWHRRVCVGVGNLQREAAEYVVDRIASVGESVGLAVGWPRCEPRVFIVFASDADAAARDLVEARGRRFRIGVSGTDLGDGALQAFQTSDRPVRWWQSSVPVDERTGRVVARLPGQAPFSAPPGGITRPADLGSQGITDIASRLRSPLRDDLSQVVIIVDVDRMAGVEIGALADYLAMIALAQIDPAVDPGPYDSILSLFSPERTPPAGLTDWDRAYLVGLYSAEQTAENPRVRLGAVATGMARIVRGQSLHD